MASNQSIFDKLNLSSGERRLVMFVLVVLMCALAWMVWGMIPDPAATRQKITKADQDLIRFQGEIDNTAEYNRRVDDLTGMGSAVVLKEQGLDMRKIINRLTAVTGVQVSRLGRTTSKTNEFFIEKSIKIDFSSKESDIVKFLWELGGSDSMVRVSDMQIQPDKNRYRLDGWMNLTASYQKDPKTFGTQPTAVAEAKTEPAASKANAKAKPAEAKSAKPAEAKSTKPAEAKPETKPSGGRRTVPKRTIPTRPVRKTQ